MDAQVLSALIAAVSAIVVTIISGIMATQRQINRIMSEFKPNGGGSLKDQINRLEKSHYKLEERVDRIFDIISQGK